MLESIPETTYDLQRNASFHQEDEYRGYGNIVVAIFSLLSINYQAFTNSNLSSNYIIAMNLYILILLALGAVVFMFCL